VTFDEARHICETVGRTSCVHIRRTSHGLGVEKRTGKIFIDYNMNVRGKTLMWRIHHAVSREPRCRCRSAGRSSRQPSPWTSQSTTYRPGGKTGDRWHDDSSEKQSLTQAFGVDR